MHQVPSTQATVRKHRTPIFLEQLFIAHVPMTVSMASKVISKQTISFSKWKIKLPTLPQLMSF